MIHTNHLVGSLGDLLAPRRIYTSSRRGSSKSVELGTLVFHNFLDVGVFAVPASTRVGKLGVLSCYGTSLLTLHLCDLPMLSVAFLLTALFCVRDPKMV